MKYRKKPEHNPDNYLKAILESIEHYNAYERSDIANWLYEGYKKVKDISEKKNSRKAIVLEIVSKWIQLFEDLAILCLMFAGSYLKQDKRPIVDPSREPFEIYSYVDNQTILKFYSLSKKGLDKAAIAKIYAYKPAQELRREGVISSKEYSYFKAQIDHLVETEQQNFNKIGRLYSSRKIRGKLNYGSLVKTYFQTKHGFKVIHPTTTSQQLWNIKDEDIVLVKGVVKMRSGRKIMTVGLYNDFKDEDVELLIKQIKGWSDVVNEIVGAHLRRLENSNFLVPMIRRLKTNEILKSTKVKVGRNDPCPCESGLKYKKCCGLVS